jgi:hypothetical protein
VNRFTTRRPSPALVVAFIALFVALGGVSYGVATGSIESREIRNNSILGKDVRNGTLSSSDLGDSGKPLRKYGPVALALNGQATLVAYGGFTVVGQCLPSGNGTRFRAIIVTATNGSAFGSATDGSGTLNTTTPETDRIIRQVTAPINEFRHSAGASDGFSAVASNGRALEGTVHATANGQSRNCRAYGTYTRIN